MSKLRTFWMKEPGNCGDVLTPVLLERLGHQVEYADAHEADFMFIGSIASHARRGMNVVGSGIGSRGDYLATDVNWLACRGPLTGDCITNCGGRNPEVYGDPALLLPYVYDKHVAKHDVVGVFAHYVDLDDPQLTDGKWNVINPIGDPLFVVDQLRKFSPILSSSLHGIILAHAYGIPAAWVRLSDKLFGDDVKFADYAASVGIELKPYAKLTDAVPVLPTNINTSELRAVFDNL